MKDPYCKISLLETCKTKSENKDGLHRKQTVNTKVIKKTLFPKWEETFTWTVYGEKRGIEIMVFDEDKITDDFLVCFLNQKILIQF